MFYFQFNNILLPQNWFKCYIMAEDEPFCLHLLEGTDSGADTTCASAYTYPEF